MKLKDITEWSGRWSTPSGSLEVNAAVEDGVLVDLSRWGMFVMGLAVQYPDGRFSARSERRGRYTTTCLSS
jgi:hypothetical protein